MNLFQKLMQTKKAKMMVSSIGVLALVLFSTFVLYEATKVEVVIASSGEEQKVQTHKNTIEELFAEMGMTIGKHDFLSHEQNAPIEDGMKIDYKIAKQVTVNVNGREEVFFTTEETIEEFFAAQNLIFSEHDAVSHKQTDALKDGTTIHVLEGFEVAVKDGTEEVTASTTGGTVENILYAHGLELNDKDKVTPALGEKVTEDTAIEITRVTTKTEEVNEPVQYTTEKETDSSLPKGEEKVITQGQDGEVTKTYEVTYENGKEVSRNIVSEETTKESVSRVVAVGTKETKQQVASSGSVNVTNVSNTAAHPGGKTFTMQASAYTASCSGCSGYTATGINLNANPNQKVIAVDPNLIPLGSRVWVEGYGEAIAGDTGGAIKGNRIDVHVPNKSAAYSWGVRTVQVKVLN